MPLTRRRLAVIATTLLALVLAGAAVAKAGPAAQPSGGILGIRAGATLPNGSWVSIAPALQAGGGVVHGGDNLPVGPDAYLDLVDTVVGGGRGYCAGFWGERDIEYHFVSWTTHPADYYGPYPSGSIQQTQSYESTSIEVHGIHDVPDSDVDQYLDLTYKAVCL